MKAINTLTTSAVCFPPAKRVWKESASSALPSKLPFCWPANSYHVLISFGSPAFPGGNKSSVCSISAGRKSEAGEKGKRDVPNIGSGCGVVCHESPGTFFPTLSRAWGHILGSIFQEAEPWLPPKQKAETRKRKHEQLTSVLGIPSI